MSEEYWEQQTHADGISPACGRSKMEIARAGDGSRVEQGHPG
jgi:hypothetical protein